MEQQAGAQAAQTQSPIHAWFDRRSPWQRRGIAFVAGGFATLGHAPFQFVPVYVAAIVVLMWLLDASSRRSRHLLSAFVTGWFFALGHFVTGLHWVSSAFLVDSDTWGPAWGVPLTALLATAMAVYWGLGAALSMRLWTNDFRRIAVFAVCMFAAEWLRGHLFGGFPWLLAGYVWTPGEPISQSASVFGIYGLTLLTLLAAATPATLADEGPALGKKVTPILAAALCFGLVWGWGVQRLDGAPEEPPGAKPVVRVTDSGLSQREKWRARPDQEWFVLGRYLEASGGPQQSKASILVWPEGAIPTINFFVLENSRFLEALGRGLGDRALILGLTRREARGGKELYFNSAAIIDGVNGVPRVSEQIYDKNRLVPFGEYMPFEDFVSSLNIPSLQSIGGYFTPGTPPTRLIIPEAPPAVVLICYEAIFPGLVPRGNDRPGWIVIVTNDAWFGGGIGPEQHYAIARYRAIEEGLPMARAASGGVSAIIDSFGREVSSTRRRGGFAEAQIPPALFETIMARQGNLVLAALLALIGALRWLPIKRARG